MEGYYKPNLIDTFAMFIIKAVVEKVQLKMSTLLVHSWNQHPEGQKEFTLFTTSIDMMSDYGSADYKLAKKIVSKNPFCTNLTLLLQYFG